MSIIQTFASELVPNIAMWRPSGSAATLLDAVKFYDTRFNLNLSQQDKDDLVAFLKTL